jgi:abortive infection Abi-like protein
MASKVRLDAFQKRFVTSLAKEWRQTGLWPLKVALRVRLDKNKPRRDIEQVLGRLDRRLWEPRTTAGDLDSQRILLSPAGLELAEGGRADLEPLLALTRLASQRRIQEPYKPAKVSTSDLVAILVPERAGDLSRIQDYCKEFFPGSGGSANPDGSVELFAGFDIIRLERASTASDLATLRNPQPRTFASKELPKAHVALVKAIYGQARAEGAPPKFVEFVLQHRHLGDILTLIQELPYDVLDQFSLSNSHSDALLEQSRLKLRFMGYVIAAKDAEPTLFARTLPILRAHYEKNPAQAPPMPAEMLAEQLQVPLAEVLRLHDLFEGEGYAGIQLQSAGDSWAIATTSRILDWRAKGLDSYLKRREKESRKTADEIVEERWNALTPGRRRRVPKSRAGVGPNAGPAMTLEQALRGRNLGTVHAEHERGLRNLASDPPAAITAACALLEALLKNYIDQEGLELPTDQTLKPLWRVVQQHLRLDPDLIEDQDIKRLLGGLSGLVDAITTLRTHAGSAHGRGSQHRPLEEPHAVLALNAAYSLATFLLQTWDLRSELRLGDGQTQ